MRRTCMHYLTEWLRSDTRRPLVLRGARQVGKTWIVRELAKAHNKKLIEVNMEQNPQLAALFVSNEPSTIIEKLGIALETSISQIDSILFIDEIQEKPELFAKLRWFYEEMPELPVIAAGSLLEFMIGKHSISIPVGRIEYLYV